MLQFQYYTPTKVVFGKDTQSRCGELIASLSCRKVLIHYGGGSAVKSGLIAQIEKSLDEAGIGHVSLGGVKPNPRLSKAREGIELAKREKVDFVLAVGGGSVIDSSKCIALGICDDGDVWDFYARKRPVEKAAPVGAVLTIAAAGSEMSATSVITNEDGGLKRSCKGDVLRCRFAVMNPELTYTLPPYQTASGCVDILMHIFERYFVRDGGRMLTDTMSEAVMRTVMESARILMKDPENYDARAQVMWAGSLAHNGLLSSGAPEDWASHQLEHELSGMFDVAHGAGLASVWGSWARYVMGEAPERFAHFAAAVLGIPDSCYDPKQTALRGIETMEEFFRELKMPVSIRELGYELTPEQIEELAHKCSFFGTRTVGGFKVLNEEDMKAIYRMAAKLTE